MRRPLPARGRLFSALQLFAGHLLQHFIRKTVMPLYWTIDSKERLFTAVAEGQVTIDEAIALLDAMTGSGAIAYAKLLDGRAVTAAMSSDELLSLCARIRTLHENHKVGPLAVIGTPEQTVIYSRLLGALASADRPIKLFETSRRARNWLGEQMRCEAELLRTEQC